MSNWLNMTKIFLSHKVYNIAILFINRLEQNTDRLATQLELLDESIKED